MKKYIAAVALMFAAVTASNAAPTLGVTWRAQVNPKFSGVKIMSVSEGSNAQELGLEVGDFVIAINGLVVKTGAEASAEVAKAKGKLVLYMRDPKGKLYEIKADIDEPTNGFTANPNAKAKYKNVTRTKK